jgi:hypothetical protein
MRFVATINTNTTRIARIHLILLNIVIAVECVYFVNIVKTPRTNVAVNSFFSTKDQFLIIKAYECRLLYIFKAD